MNATVAGAPAYLTASLPGIGGRIKCVADDFEVEEIQKRAPRGHGAYGWALFEKRGISTPELLRRVSAAVDVRARDLGVAGWKDSTAVARQWVSFPWPRAARLAERTLRDAKLLQIERDPQPLAAGMLAGNRFRVVIRDVAAPSDEAYVRARAIVAELVRRGAPGYFGKQRFGVRGESAEVGLCLLRGDLAGALDGVLGRPSPLENDPRAAAFRDAYDREDYRDAERRAPPAMRMELGLLRRLASGRSKVETARHIPRDDLRMYLSAAQSLAFNRMIHRRMPDIDVVEAGDLVLAERGALEAANLARHVEPSRALRAHPTACMFGDDVPLAGGRQGEIERAVLQELAIDPSSLTRPAGLPLHGERRSMRNILHDAEVVRHSDPGALELRFRLDAGCYATAVAAEVTKAESPMV